MKTIVVIFGSHDKLSMTHVTEHIVTRVTCFDTVFLYQKY